MKCRKRSIIYVLLAGLIFSTSNCTHKKETFLQLITYKTLAGFPSASAIEYDNNRLYIFGDDAPYLLVLDTLYNPFDSVSFLTDTAYRISKDTKPDIESTTLITHLDEKHLYALGSFSTKERQSLYYFPLAYTDSFLKISLHNTTELFRGLEEINIEGLAFTGTSFIMANRANYSNRSNHLIISNELNPSAENLYSVIELILDTSTVKGISGLYYHLERDILFFTASEEETNNAFEDGVIKDSYLGWISSFSDKQDNKKVSADQLIKLSDVDKAFTSQKIESLCVQDVRRDHFTLHLVADNDKGQSRIFKMILKL